MSFFVAKVTVFLSEKFEKDSSESYIENYNFQSFLCEVCEHFETFRGLEYKNGSTTNAVDIPLAFVGGICWFVFVKCLNLIRKSKNYRKFPFLTILVVFCEIFMN